MTLKRKFARIDLTEKKITIHEVPRQWRYLFLGGSGMSAYLLYKYMLPESDPFSRDNTIIISSGLLGGSPAAGISHAGFAFKSPLTNTMAYSTYYGPLAAEMRWAGFDYIMIQGGSDKPVNLHIQDKRIKILDAAKLWGMNTTDAMKQMRNERGTFSGTLFCTGPAGENRVRFANMTDERGVTFGGAGLGAVFGSKRIKSVLCEGTGTIEIKDPEAVLAWHRASGISWTRKNKSPEHGKPDARDAGYRRWFRESGIDFKTGMAMLTWSSSQGGRIEALPTGMAEFELYPSGGQTEKTNVEMIASRKGFGEILAGGPLRASERLGGDSLKYFGSVQRLLEIYCGENPVSAAVDSPAPKEPKPIPPFPEKREPAPGPDKSQGDGLDENSWVMPLMDPVKRVCNGLGVAHSDIFFNGKAGGLDVLKELIHVNSGLVFNPADLMDLAFRSDAVERLLDIRETPLSRGSSLSDFCFHPMDGSILSMSVLQDIDLKKYRFEVQNHYRLNHWDKKNLLKLKTFKDLRIHDLWPHRKRT